VDSLYYASQIRVKRNIVYFKVIIYGAKIKLLVFYQLHWWGLLVYLWSVYQSAIPSLSYWINFPGFSLLWTKIFNWKLLCGVVLNSYRSGYKFCFAWHISRRGVLCYGVVRPPEFVQTVTPDPHCRFEQYFTWLLPWTKRSVMTLIQGYRSEVKVTIHIMVEA
jgi:hypothetical protein